jgi:hypothetical protein
MFYIVHLCEPYPKNGLPRTASPWPLRGTILIVVWVFVLILVRQGIGICVAVAAVGELCAISGRLVPGQAATDAATADL